MPFIIRPPRMRTAIAACAAALMVGAVPAQASKFQEITSASKCTEPTLYQPFLGFGDSNYYALPAGESYDIFTGKGWVLSGGAGFIPTPLYDGRKGTVLNKHDKSQAARAKSSFDTDYAQQRRMY